MANHRPFNPNDVEAALAKAPERVRDPNDPAAVEAFWKNATLRADGADWLDPEGRVALRALAASQEDIEAGRLVEAEDVLRELRAPGSLHQNCPRARPPSRSVVAREFASP
jgi:hypothetical protein